MNDDPVIEVHRLRPDDWRLWRELRLAALADAPRAFGTSLAEWSGENDTERRWRARLTGVAFNAVLFRDGVPAGMVSATDPDGRGPVQLLSLWVAPSARGLGVGDAAVRAVLRWADDEHAGSEVALSVKVDNLTAVAVYERNGFVSVGTSPDNRDEMLMRHVRAARRP